MGVIPAPAAPQHNAAPGEDEYRTLSRARVLRLMRPARRFDNPFRQRGSFPGTPRANEGLMRHLWQEFKQFAFKGNMIELAVAVIIGAAFGQVISSLANDVIMRGISYVIPAKMSYTEWRIGSEEKGILVGKFLGAVINFLIVATVVFVVVVKLMGAIIKQAPPPAPFEPVTKECPLCLSTIPAKARKCSHCTADLLEAA
jgi:large conductance mechanosensitive channel